MTLLHISFLTLYYFIFLSITFITLSYLSLPHFTLLCLRPFGVVLLNTLLEGLNRILTVRGRSDRSREVEGREALGGDTQVVQRAANVLCLLFVHGGMLASELSTVINTSHTSLHGESK